MKKAFLILSAMLFLASTGCSSNMSDSEYKVIQVTAAESMTQISEKTEIDSPIVADDETACDTLKTIAENWAYSAVNDWLVNHSYMLEEDLGMYDYDVISFDENGNVTAEVFRNDEIDDVYRFDFVADDELNLIVKKNYREEQA